MAADYTDKFKRVATATLTTLASPGKALGATSINVGSTTNYPTDTSIIISIRSVDAGGNQVAGTYTEWNAIVTSGTSLSIEAAPVYGSDQIYAAASTTQVYMVTSSYGQNTLIDGILTSIDQDGTLKAGAVDNAACLASDVVETAKIKDANVTAAKLATDAVETAKIKNLAVNAAKLNEVTLFNGSTARVVTLSDTYTNYKRLYIIYSWGGYKGEVVMDTDLANINFPVVMSGLISGTYKIIVGHGNIAFSGTTCTGAATGSVYSILCTDTSVVSFADSVAEIQIVKVVGLKS